MNVDLAVGRDAHEAVEAVAAGRVIGRADADGRAPSSRCARRCAPAAARPTEQLGAAVERILQIGARDAALHRADLGRVVGRIDAPDRDAVEPELLRGLVDQRLDGRRDLVLARARAAGRAAACS